MRRTVKLYVVTHQLDGDDRCDELEDLEFHTDRASAELGAANLAMAQIGARLDDDDTIEDMVAVRSRIVPRLTHRYLGERVAVRKRDGDRAPLGQA